MQKHAGEFSVERMSNVLGVSRSGYYQFIKAELSKRYCEDERLLSEIKEVYAISNQIYGSPRIHAELRARGERCSRKRVCRLMKAAHIAAKMKKRFKVTLIVDPKAAVAPNLLKQKFTATRPDQYWAADITYIPTQEGWWYVAIVLDLFSRSIVGMDMQAHMTTELVAAALRQAITRRKPAAGLIHHSDRGSQYTSKGFKAVSAHHQITLSMSSTGNCYDNAVAESFFHTLKTEHTHFERFESREQAKLSIFEYVEVFYNRQRRHSTLGYLSPVNFEKNWLSQVA